ncbi:sensor histidine kinase [Arthrobacter sp.]|uniref:sensor histidine kinase n=1 Tax=Arthrobacter sp. TaxID=1667 RepID=UPI003A911071
MAGETDLGRWLRACAEVGRLLGDTEPDGEDYDSIANQALEAAGASLALVLLPVGEQHHRIAGASGKAASLLRGQVFATPPTLGADPAGTGEPAPGGGRAGHHIAEALEAAGETALTSRPGLVDWLARAQLLVAGLGQDTGRDRFLVLARPPDAAGFADVDLQLAGLLAAQVEQAIGRAHIRQLHEQLAVFAERDRIARDLHDIVIQRLFAAGLGVRALAGHLEDAASRARAEEITGELDATIGELRDTIYALRHSVGEREQLGTAIVRAVRAACEPLPFTPRLRLGGPLDAIEDERTTANLLAVITEALSNAVRHAHATRISISVTVDEDELRLRVKDNGHGFSGPTLRSGLANMDRRAAELGGTCHVGSNRRGTRVQWTVPVR